MKLQTPMKKGLLVKRYKRFFADIEADGHGLTIHVPNTGSLKDVIAKSGVKQQILYTPSNDPNRKLKGTLEAVQTIDGDWVGVNTSWPNKLIAEFIQAQLESPSVAFSQWSGFNFYKPEIKISKETRLDGVLLKKKEDLDDPRAPKHFIEIKNTTLMSLRNQVRQAQFPDSVTERGVKHLLTLMDLIKQGHTAEIIFAIQRNDCTVFSVADDIDPAYGKAFRQAVAAGVWVTPLLLKMNKSEIYASGDVLPVQLN